MTTAKRQAVIELLELANNGYTYEQAIPGDLKETLAQMVNAGLVVRRTATNPARRTMMTNIYIKAEEAEHVIRCMKNPR